MDLTDLVPRLTGRATKEIDCEYVGDLTEADIDLLSTEAGIQPIDPLKLRDSHHALARTLARGARPAEAAAITGYSPARISILQRSPAFQEILAHYRENLDVTIVDYRERLRNAGMDVVEWLREDMEENPNNYSPGQRTDIMKIWLDRGGLGPESRSVNMSLNVDIAGRLERGLARAEAAKTIDHEE
jgi:hypothetical protein